MPNDIKYRIGLGKASTDVNIGTPPNQTPAFTFDSTVITFDSTTRTFDETT